ncbi:metacaspase-2 isoform X2 [Daucus carota subsp. sativus]|uniref:metacaspase-2 isoform X2 n=1 Tax=Daucus carota subsp. sativus TaxID=79200 RepID=UPI0007EF8F4C|nr:PREDICTED: metacaspase-2-like isoform X2 [Daucus carota subsp. sativus]
MASMIKLCNFCRAEIRVPFEARRGIECPVCGNINSYGGPPIARQYAGNGPQQNGYQYPPPRRPAPRGPPGGANGHGYYQQPWSPQASDDDYIEHPPPPRQGPFHLVRPNRHSYQPPPQVAPRPMRPNFYQQPPPRRPSYPPYNNDYYQPQPRPMIKVNNIYRPPQPQGPRRPAYNGYYQQPSPMPMEEEDYHYQNQPIPQASHRPVHDNNNGYDEQETPPLDDYYQEQLQTSPQVPNNGSYQRQPSRAESQAQSSPMNGNNNQQFSHNQEGSPPQPPPQARPNGYNQQQPGLTVTSSHIQQVTAHTSNAQPAYGRKKAVVCGVSYLGQKNYLEASSSDARSIKDFLVNNLKFPEASIFLLTEDEEDPSRIPTRINIFRALKWLVESCQPGDSLVFYYTGHGSKERDFDGDEIDGFDEVLCPVDYQTAGKITDDEINATIVRPLPPGAKLHGIIDCCFSGTVLDLPFLSKTDSKGTSRWVDQRIQYAAYKGTSGGIAISISSCTDHQKSGDTTAFTGKSTGALTYSFIHALRKQPNITYGSLLNSMRTTITQVQQRDQPPQEPQISSTEKFDIHSKPLIM